MANKHLSLTSLEIASEVLQDSLLSDIAENLTEAENARDALRFDQFLKPD